jgi:hypothetical protein
MSTEPPRTVAERKVEIVARVLAESEAWALDAIEDLLDNIADTHRSEGLVIGRRPSGDPVIKSRFMRELMRSIHEVEQGNGTSLRTLERESENW